MAGYRQRWRRAAALIIACSIGISGVVGVQAQAQSQAQTQARPQAQSRTTTSDITHTLRSGMSYQANVYPLQGVTAKDDATQRIMALEVAYANTSNKPIEGDAFYITHNASDTVHGMWEHYHHGARGFIGPTYTVESSKEGAAQRTFVYAPGTMQPGATGVFYVIVGVNGDAESIAPFTMKTRSALGVHSPAVINTVDAVTSTAMPWLAEIPGIERKLQAPATTTLTTAAPNTTAPSTTVPTVTKPTVTKPTVTKPTVTQTTIAPPSTAAPSTTRAWDRPAYPRPGVTTTQAPVPTSTQQLGPTPVPTMQPDAPDALSGSSLVSMWRSSEVFRIISAIIGITALSTIAALVGASVTQGM